MISGNMVGSYSQIGRTFTLVDDSGNEITGVIVDQETLFTATDNDVREGVVYASDDGVSTGTKNIPTYRTTSGHMIVLPNSDFTIAYLDKYEMFNYTELQCIITLFNSNINDSVSAEKVVINNVVYNVGTTIELSDVVRDIENKVVNLNIKNDSENTYLIRYFTYKEEP